MRKIFYVLSLGFFLSFYSCSLQDDYVEKGESTSMEALRDSLLLENVYLNSPNVGTRSAKTEIGDPYTIIAKIATKKSGCIKGFGLCDFQLVSNKYLSTNNDLLPQDYQAVSFLQKDSVTNKYYAELLLSKPIPKGLPENKAYLEIDDDLYWVNDSISNMLISDLGDSLMNTFNGDIRNHEFYKIAKGNVPYESNLGLYGGYIINFHDETND